MKPRSAQQVFDTETFIQKARAIHGDLYDYRNVEYVNYNTAISIVCKKHGEFLQTPRSHLVRQCGCQECARISRIEHNTKFKSTTKQFVDKAKKIHDNFYDYTEVKYITAHNKVKIVCPEHGTFFQTPNSHLTGYGCYKCGHKGSIAHVTEKMGILYLLHMKFGDEHFIKLGITSTPSVKNRFKGTLGKITIIKQIRMPFCDAYTIEQELLSKYKKYQHNSILYPQKKFGGITECFSCCILPGLLVDLQEMTQNEYHEVC